MNVYNYSTNIFIYTRIYLQNGECIFMYSTYIYIYTPVTQMTLVLIVKGLLLVGSNPRIEAIHRFQVYTN